MSYFEILPRLYDPFLLLWHTDFASREEANSNVVAIALSRRLNMEETLGRCSKIATAQGATTKLNENQVSYFSNPM